MMKYNRIHGMKSRKVRRKAFFLLAMLLCSGMASAQVRVKGNVYGGCELGKVTQSANVTINNGTMEGTVYGGGMGDPDADTAGWVKGNTTITMTNGTVERSIYGGGELGSVGNFTAYERLYYYNDEHQKTDSVDVPTACASNTGLAKVLVSGGTVGVRGSLMPFVNHNPDDDDRGWIFCGGCGERDSINHPKANALAVVNATRLEISGDAVITASVYGGCENGLVLDSTYVKIMGGQIGTGYHKVNNQHEWDDPYTDAQWAEAISAFGNYDNVYTQSHPNPFHECNSWPYEAPYAVYDIFAEDPAAPSGSALQGSDGHSFFGNVFGGGSGYYPIAAGVWRRSAGRVNGNTRIDITGGHILTSIYGGNEVTDVLGKTTINMSGGTLGVPRDSASIVLHPVTCYLFGAGMGDPRTYFNTWTNVQETEVNITGGTIFGSIFGGGEEGHVLGDVNVTIENDDTHIGTWGYTYVDGNVFGGGRGFSGTALTAGSVGGNVTVDIKGGTMLGSIYGGGRLASVGTYFVPTTSPNYGQLQPGPEHGYITVNITGGMIGNEHEDRPHPAHHTFGGNVYGGCMGRVTKLDGTQNDLWPRLACAKQTQVNITGTDTIAIKGNVYGGPELGHVHDSAIVIANNAKLSVHKIFGGGHGSDDITHYHTDSAAYPAKLAGRVVGHTLVELRKGLVNLSVYGGGEYASVGLMKDNTPLGGHTHVVISGGSVGENNQYVEDSRYLDDTHTDHAGHVFGGGQGVENDTIEAYRDYCNVNYAKVTVQGGKIYGSVFGGGAESHVLCNDTVYIHAGADIGTVGTTSWDGNVFGGGKGNGYYETEIVNGETDTVAFHAYMTAGRVGGNTYINMDGGSIKGSIFGGGRMGLTGISGIDNSGNPVLFFKNENVYDSINHGLATIKVSGTTEVGHSTLDPTVDSTIYHTLIGINDGVHLLKSDESVGDIFGSGKGDTENYDDIWAGRVAKTVIEVTGSPRIFGSVFGGGEMASIGYWANSGKFYKGTGASSVTIGKVNTNDNPVIGTDYEFSVAHDENPGQWTIYETIDGVTKIEHTATGNVFGGCQGDVDPEAPHWPSFGRSRQATVNIYGGTIKSSVYGGGEQGTVIGNTQVNVSGGTIGWPTLTDSDGKPYSYGSIFGGGYGTTILTDHENDSTQNGVKLAGRTYGNTEVNFSGGHVYANVFGGGDLASVGWVNSDGDLMNGHCIVNVTGTAIVGPLDMTGLNGYVYGGGKGVGNDPDDPATPNIPDEKFKEYCNVNSTEVNINLNNNGHVWGSLFGGGADGHVLGDANVTLDGGLIGTDGTTTWDGNIFGGGRNFLKKNYTAGRVGGNIHVVMNNGTLQGSIFGGGRLGLTGIDENGVMQDGTAHGNTLVEVKGGTVGNASLVETWTTSTMGDVYGGGKGDMVGVKNHPAASALLVSLVKNTEVKISGTARVLGSVFGGGEVANVGRFSWGEVDDSEGHPTIGDIQMISDGLAKVTVEGGIIGAEVAKMRCDIADGAGNYNLTYNDDRGHVFGGGEGRGGNPYDYDTINPSSGTPGIHNNKSLLDLMATVNNTEVTISNSAWVKGSVYGGSMNGHVLSNAKVTVSGGQIGAGYYPATSTTLEKDSLYAEDKFFNPITYFGTNHTNYTDVAAVDVLNGCYRWDFNITDQKPFDPIAIKADPTANKPTTGETWFGSVYGGGSGYYPYIVRNHNNTADSCVWNPDAGKVFGNTEVVITDGHILSNVYGGCQTTDVDSTAVVTMSGGSVGVPRTVNSIMSFPFTSNLFGGAQGDFRKQLDHLSDVDSTRVTISGNALVYGSVFGGSQNGHVLDSTKVLVQGGVIGTTGLSGSDGNVFGGGQGTTCPNPGHQGDTLYAHAGRVGGNARVMMTNGKVLGNLYGGGFVALVGVGENGWFSDFVTGTTYPYEDHGMVKVEVRGGSVGNYFKNGINLLKNAYPSGNVYGGGRGKLTEYRQDDIARTANAAVKISGSPRIYGSVYGGGQMANVGYWMGYELGWYADGTAATRVNITDSPKIGTELEFIGGDDYSHDPGNWTIFDTIRFVKYGATTNDTTYLRMLTHTRTGNVYGGGEGEVKIDNNGYVVGLEQGHCRATYVNINMVNGDDGGHIMSSVYGGSEEGAVWGETEVHIAGGTIGTMRIKYDSLKYVYGSWSQPLNSRSTYSFGSVYGGSYGKDYKSMNINNPSQQVRDSINVLSGRVYGNTLVDITGGAIRGNVYGGGDMASVGIWNDNFEPIPDSQRPKFKGNVEITVSGGTVGPLDGTGLNAYVFGGGKGFYNDPDELRKTYVNVDSTFVTISGGKIHGSVFGGGNDSHVLGSAYVKVTDNADIGTNGLTTWDGNIFGGGRDFVNSNHTNGRVAGNIDIVMNGGAIQGSIFGGGRMALTGVDVHGDPYLTDAGKYDAEYHGFVTINVTNDTIFSMIDPALDSIVHVPSIGNPNGNELLNGSDESVGDIFGSGKGDTKAYDDIFSGRVANTKITVTGSPHIYGSVFGGGEMASIGYWHKVGDKQVYYDDSGVSEIIIGREDNATDNPIIGTDYEFSPEYFTTDHDWTVYDTDNTLIHTCTGNVYGGCQGDVDPESPHWVSMARSRTTTVTINGGIIKSRVFGGGEQGSVAGNTHVTINGGTIGSLVTKPTNGSGGGNGDGREGDVQYYFGGVYGGGYGSHREDYNGTTYQGNDIENDSTAYLSNGLWTANYLAGRVYGNTRVDVYGGTLQGDVYGGSAYAYLGGYGTNANGNVLVNIGKESQMGTEHSTEGPTFRSVQSGNSRTGGSVYGANNRSGTPYGNVMVNVISTAHTEDNQYPAFAESAVVTPSCLDTLPHAIDNFAIFQVYGGSNKADYLPYAGKADTVHVWDCKENTIYDVYGGCNAASIGSTTNRPINSNVFIDGGRIFRVFGGGNGSGGVSSDIHGTATTKIKGGVINQVFGGSNSLGQIELVNLLVEDGGTCNLVIGDGFGGGNNAEIYGDVVTNIECGAGSYQNFYGGANLANIYGNVTLNVFGGTFDNLFAGSKGCTAADQIPEYPEGKSADILDNPRTADRKEGNVTLNLFGGNIYDAAYGGSDANGRIEGKIRVNVFNAGGPCDIDLDTVFGAGRATKYEPFYTLEEGETYTYPEVNIIHGTVKGCVFGGGEGVTATTTANPVVNIGYDAVSMGDPNTDETLINTLFDTIRAHYCLETWEAPADYIAYVQKHVYGGGNQGDINGSPTVNIMKHSTIVDGSVFGGGHGKILAQNETLQPADSVVGLVHGSDTVRIRAGHVKEYVFGGGELASVEGNTYVELTGGEVGSMTIHKVKDNEGNPVDSIIPGLNIPYYELTGGHVYGGGRGYLATGNHNDYRNFGHVKGNTYVHVSDTAKIHDCVFGGGALGSVGSGRLNDKTSGVATVIISGGEIGPLDGTGLNAYVYGGGRGKDDDQPGAFANYANVDSTSVIVCDSARIYGSIFGGGSDGHVLGDARILVEKGTNTKNKIPVIGTNGLTSWDGNIFGGGRNYMYSNLTAGRVGGNILIDMTDGELKGNVYGGGRMGLTGMDPVGDTIPDADHGYITVNISGGTIGSAVDMATIGNVFGGGKGILEDSEGDPVMEYQSLGRVKATEVNISGNARIYGSVYGGGEIAKVSKNTNVTVSGGIIGSLLTSGGTNRRNGSVFGGGKGAAELTVMSLNDPAEVWGNSNVLITGGQVMENVYGGGELASVGQMVEDWDTEVQVNMNSVASVTVTGGQIGPLDNTGLNGYVYGGGQGIGDDLNNNYKNIANVIETNVTIDIPSDVDPALNRVWGSLFGGGADGHVLNDAKVELKSGIIGTNGTTSWDGNIFGGGRNFQHTNYTAGRVGGNIIVNMKGGTLLGSIFGGGRLGITGIDENGDMIEGDDHGKVTINITGGTVGNATLIGTFNTYSMGDVFGGGKGTADTLFDNSHNVITLPEELARVKNTEVKISETARVLGNVYGGGEVANVGWYETVNNHYQAVANTGRAKVDISGGQVGMEQIGTQQDKIVGGSVFGGGLGLAGDKAVMPFGNVDTTYVKISGDAYIVNSVFGGADNGHVIRNTSVEMIDGTVGQKNTLAELSVDENEQASTTHIYTGSVMAGGRGITPVNGRFCDTTGIVLGNATVKVTGGTIRHGVYGGGGLSHVGTIESKNSSGVPVFKEGTGICKVTVEGGHIGPIKEDMTGYSGADSTAFFKNLGGNAGWVFGSGCGLTGPGYDVLTYNDSSFVTVSGNAQVVGAVFGGGENGHVARNTRVDISGGTIGGIPLHGTGVINGTGDFAGLSFTSDVDELHEDEYGAGRYVFRGNVYGGGKGTDYVSTGVYSQTAGRVYGNTTVNVTDGTIYNRVYGGGSLASVGTYTHHDGPLPSGLSLGDQIQRISYVDGTGVTHVNVNGGTIGTDGNNNGDVVGGGRGMVGHAVDTINVNGDYCDQVTHLAYVNSTHVNISQESGRTTNIKSNVYGGSINGHVYSDSHVSVTGGTIGIQGHHGWHSNVFGGGGGSGRYLKNGQPHLSISSGRVFGNTNVEITGGTVLHNVYGGGAIASVGTYDLRASAPSPFVENTGLATVTITGANTVIGYDGDENGMVFGSGRGDIDSVGAYMDSLSYVVKTRVTIGTLHANNGPKVNGSVYGSGENGHVYDSAIVNIHSGTIGCTDLEYTNNHSNTAWLAKFPYRGNVYGGGCGTDTITSGTQRGKYNPTAGVVTGNTKVTIDGGLISHNVYGGGAMANVGLSHLGINQEGNGHTNIIISGGQIGLEDAVQNHGQKVGGGTVFGGSRGAILDTVSLNPEWGQLANVNSTDVTIKDTAFIKSSVFGGSEAGRVRGNTTVKIQETATIGAQNQNLALHRGHVYGGGSGNDSLVFHNPTTPTLVDSVKLNQNAGQVGGNSRIEMSGGVVYGNLYGGCELTDVLGHATVIKNGGQVGWERSAEQILARPYYGYVYGSGKGNPGLKYNTWTNVDSTYVEINDNPGRIWGSVLGGGEEGHVLRHTHVVVKNGTIGTKGDTHYDGNVFGAGRGWNPVALTAGSIGGNTYVDIEDGHIIGSVFGGGNNGTVGLYLVADTSQLYGQLIDGPDHGFTHVNVTGGTIGHEITEGANLTVGGNVYGGGRGMAGAPDTPFQKVGKVKQTEVNISQASGKQTFVMGSVFGSGEDGHVVEDTYVNIYDGQIGGELYVAPGEPAPCEDPYHGNVYGGGRGLDRYVVTEANGDTVWIDPNHHELGPKLAHSITAGIVGGNTNVNIYGGRIVRSVYGGGNLSSVGNPEETPDENGNYQTGLATVNIVGGTIGFVGEGSSATYDYKDFGNVFGSGHGGIGGEYLNLAYVKNTHVTVDSTALIYGSVFGGGEDGHVRHNTLVDMKGGTVGQIQEDFLHGNVYGGGRGIVQEHGNVSETAGEVFGHATVNLMQSEKLDGDGKNYTPTVYNNVYGGGSRSVVGEYKVVNISAGTVHDHVFGGSRDIPSKRSNKAPRWVNMWGGTVEGNIYGCSHNSIDSVGQGTKDDWASFINLSGGTIKGNVFGAGYGGDIEGIIVDPERGGLVGGSVAVLIGKKAIESAYLTEINVHKPTTVVMDSLNIQGSVFAGADDVYNVNWGDNAVSGYSNIYIDGTGYNTTDNHVANYMNIAVAGGIYGSGNNCEAGKSGHDILFRNYGARNSGDELTEASRSLKTIQRAGTVILDSVNVNLVGADDISRTVSIDTSYAVIKVDSGLYLTNSTGLALGAANSPVFMDSIRQVKSLYLKENNNVYEQMKVDGNENWYVIGIKEEDGYKHLYRVDTVAGQAVIPTGELGNALTAAEENVIIFNDTSMLLVRYWDNKGSGSKQYYGHLQGFFRMRADDFDPFEDLISFAYARPKITDGTVNASVGNISDGGFLSYDNGLNYFEDRGTAFTNTKQHPYINELHFSKGDREERRLWIASQQRDCWYVDGTRGWGRDILRTIDPDAGRYPDKPKLTLFGKNGNNVGCGVVSETYTVEEEARHYYSYKRDLIYVVGALTEFDDAVLMDSVDLVNNKYYPLRLYRYPGGHIMSNSEIDYGGGTAPLDSEDWGMPNEGTDQEIHAGPGANYGAMLDVLLDSTITLRGVLMDGLYGYTPQEIDSFNIPTPTNPNHLVVPDSVYFHPERVNKPMILTHGKKTEDIPPVYKGSTLNLERGTVLKRGFNSTNAYDWYTDADYTPYSTTDTTYQGAAIFVDTLAIVNVGGSNTGISADSITIIGNMQRLRYPGESEDSYIESNVYLPTFVTKLNITDKLQEKTRIGITNPKRKTDESYESNTLSYVAYLPEGSVDTLKTVWKNNNFVDDQDWFFGNGNKSTYHDSFNGGDGGSRYLNFGWTWANVVRKAPEGFDFEDINSAEDLAWLISHSVGMNRQKASSFTDTLILQTADVDMKQYVWVPIGDSIPNSYDHKPFKGIYDGQGHLIKNLSIEYIGNEDNRYELKNYGMFGYVKGGTINRTFVVSGIINPKIAAAETFNLGGLVGCMEDDFNKTSIVSNSEAALKIDCPVMSESPIAAGGLVAKLVSGEVHSSMAMPFMNHSDSLTKYSAVGSVMGGLVGYSVNGRINNSFVNGRFSIIDAKANKGKVFVGGLLGENESAIVRNCYVNIPNDNDLTNAYIFRGIVSDNPSQSSTNDLVDSCYVKQGYSIHADTCGSYSGRFAPTYSADMFGYMYADNRVVTGADGNSTDTTLFLMMNRWVDTINKHNGNHKYARWARPGLQEINGDLPVLLLSEFDGKKAHQGGFRSVGTYAGGNVLQYGGPARDSVRSNLHEVDDALAREQVGTNKDNLFIYGDVEKVGAGSITQGKVSIYEHASIKSAGVLANEESFNNTYVGITFDNSCGHAMSTAGVNFMGSKDLPRDWHMMSTPLSNAPLGFNYYKYKYNDGNLIDSTYTNNGNYNSGDQGDSELTFYNNPWRNESGEFSWLIDNGQPAKNRYWMKGWRGSQIGNQTFVQKNWVDGYFPSKLADGMEYGATCIPDADESEHYPYGMDFYTWYEPEYHWINFKRNGPNHWHSDEPHYHLDYYGDLANYGDVRYMNKNEDYLVQGKGYMASIAVPTLLQSHGALNADAIPVTITKKGDNCKGWNLVGNPFHGYLDFDVFAKANGLSRPYYVVYDADGYGDKPESAFLYYPEYGSKNGAYAGRYLHPHQAFFIEAEGEGEIQQIEFSEIAVVEEESQSMVATRSSLNYLDENFDGHYRGENLPSYPLVNLFLSSDKGCSDITVVEFERPEWGGARKLRELRRGNGLFYGYHNEQGYAALFAEEGTTRVPLWFEAKEDDIFTIKWNTANGDFNSLYLIDNILGVQYDMLANNTYTFEGHKQDYKARFYIVFDVTGVEEEFEQNIFAFFDGSQWVVTGEGELDLVDMQGRILWHEKLSGGQSRLAFPTLAKSMYLLRLTNSSETKVQKIIVK